MYAASHFYIYSASPKLTTEPTQKLVVDGEVFDGNPVEFICVPNGLTIFSQLG